MLRCIAFCVSVCLHVICTISSVTRCKSQSYPLTNADYLHWCCTAKILPQDRQSLDSKMRLSKLIHLKLSVLPAAVSWCWIFCSLLDIIIRVRRDCQPLTKPPSFNCLLVPMLNLWYQCTSKFVAYFDRSHSTVNYGYSGHGKERFWRLKPLPYLKLLRWESRNWVILR